MYVVVLIVNEKNKNTQITEEAVYQNNLSNQIDGIERQSGDIKNLYQNEVGDRQ